MISLKQSLEEHKINKSKISLKEDIFPYLYSDGLTRKTISLKGFVLEKDTSEFTFPLAVKPENDKYNSLGFTYNWAGPDGSNMSVFRASRGARLHAARDLYTKPYEQVYSVTNGEVLSITYFYMNTYEVTVLHETMNGEKFIARYGELDQKSIAVSVGQKIYKNQPIGKTGKLLNTNGSPLVVIGGKIIYMLHFELYTGARGTDLAKYPLTNSTNPYKRRSDLIDPIDLLTKGYNARFKNTETVTDTDFQNRVVSAVSSVFGTLNSTKKQVLTYLVNDFKIYGDSDLRKLAYIITTAQYESNLTPIKEYRAAAGTPLWHTQNRYWYTGFYGRGLVQITWEDNYRKMSNFIGVDLVKNKELALQLDIASKICVYGMVNGSFTLKKLSDYLNSMTEDYAGARDIVNPGESGKRHLMAADAKRIFDLIKDRSFV